MKVGAGSIPVSGSLMKPIIDNMQLFTLDRVPTIRLNREVNLAAGLDHHRSTKKKRKTSTRKRKAVTLTVESQMILAGMDETTRKFLEKAMKG